MVPRPPDPPDAEPTTDREETSAAVAPVQRRRIGPVEVALGVIGLAAVAAVVVVLQSGSTGTGGTGGTGGTSSTPTPTQTPTTVRTQEPPVDQPLVGRACAFYDVGVLDRSGTAVLQCVLQEDGTYVWQNRQ